MTLLRGEDEIEKLLLTLLLVILLLVVVELLLLILFLLLDYAVDVAVVTPHDIVDLVDSSHSSSFSTLIEWGL